VQKLETETIMENIDFNKIDEARKILGLGEKATLKEIKSAYREKAKKK